MSVASINLTDKNYVKFKKQNHLFILGMSDSHCKYCCQNEPFLKLLKDEFDAGNYKYKDKPILVARVDLRVKHNFV